MEDRFEAAPENARADISPGATSRPRRMIICDGYEGMLTLDLRFQDTHWLIDACRQLATGSTPPNAGIMKVSANGTIYLVSAPRSRRDGVVARIVNMYDPSERVDLSDDLIRIVAGLISSAGPSYGSADSVDLGS